MGESTALAPLAIPPEVEAFAAEKGAAQYLPAVAALVQRIVPNHKIDVRVVDDPELSYNRTIDSRVEVRGWGVDQLVEADQRWSAEIFDFCPAPLVHVFGFCISPVE